MPSVFELFFASIPGALEQGLLAAPMALGVLITYLVLDFPDLTVDGSYPLGGAVSTALLLSGASPLIALLAALLAGAAAGLMTGLIHVKLKVRALFSGIIMMTALYSINLRIAGGNALMSIPRESVTLFRNNPLSELLPRDLSVIIIALLVVLVFKYLMDWFFQTRTGMLLLATGDNEVVVTSLAQDKGKLKLIGLSMANALVALSGAVVCQQQRLFEISMGTGAVVFSLASVIIGINVLKRFDRLKNTIKVVIGTLMYKLSVSFAISCGLKPGDMKLVTALLFLIILSFSQFGKKAVKDA